MLLHLSSSSSSSSSSSMHKAQRVLLLLVMIMMLMPDMLTRIASANDVHVQQDELHASTFAVKSISTSSFSSSSKFEMCGSGTWKQLTKTDAEKNKLMPAARNSLVIDVDSSSSSSSSSKIAAANDQWLKDACPAQIVQHSCYAHGNLNRAFAVEHRVWQPLEKDEESSSSCKEFSGLNFLSFLKGKTLHMVGDSVMMQTWVSFVCELRLIQKSSLKVDFFHHTERTGGGKFNNRSCPWQSKHCHVHGGVLFFPDLSTSLEYHSCNRADTFQFVDNSNYIYLINDGLHFHDQQKYTSMLQGLSNNLKRHLGVTSTNKATFFFLETYPQHFSASNGDYDMRNTGLTNRTGIDCFPKLDFEQNWRNKLAHSLLDKRIRVIPIERQLNSQWDAHVANSKLVPYSEPDCTHWCYPSAAFNYVQRAIYNYIVQPLE